MKKKKLLIDACCGPCSTQVISELLKKYEISLLFPNSNIYPKSEYDRRYVNLKKVANEYELDVVEEPYNHDEWLEFIEGHENEPEGGKRCLKCFEFRFIQSAKFAKSHGFDCFTTTLTISPFKNAKQINAIGKKIGMKNDVGFLGFDFSKGYQKSIELSKEMELYRQKYCGCEFSMKSGKAKK